VTRRRKQPTRWSLGVTIRIEELRNPTETNEMNDNQRLTDRQLRVIPYLLTSHSTEEACRRARINKTTVYEWLKDETFRRELKRQRDTIIERALDSLKANIAKATKTLLDHLNSKRENISIRAAEDIIEFTQKALEHEELEKRIEALEEQMAERQTERSYR
jgi:Transposase